MNTNSQTPVAPAEQRVAVRRQPTLGTVCRLDTGHGKGKLLGLVWNLSRTGISMLLHEAVEPGQEVIGELNTLNDKNALPVALRAVHLNKLRTGDYFLGAQFKRPLSPEEMRPFLGGVSA